MTLPKKHYRLQTALLVWQITSYCTHTVCAILKKDMCARWSYCYGIFRDSCNVCTLWLLTYMYISAKLIDICNIFCDSLVSIVVSGTHATRLRARFYIWVNGFVRAPPPAWEVPVSWSVRFTGSRSLDQGLLYFCGELQTHLNLEMRT